MLLLWWLVIGVATGWLVSFVLALRSDAPQKIVCNIVSAALGASVAGWVKASHDSAGANDAMDLLVPLGGALAFLAAVTLASRRDGR